MLLVLCERFSSAWWRGQDSDPLTQISNCGVPELVSLSDATTGIGLGQPLQGRSARDCNYVAATALGCECPVQNGNHLVREHAPACWVPRC